MRNPCPYLYILICLLFSCNKLELPTQDETDGNDAKPEVPVVPPTDGDTLSVAAALQMIYEDLGVVKGYMVGYVKGTSINTGAIFGLPNTENTNFLMADDPKETNPQKCIAVKLEKTGKFACRAELNMKDHPEFFRKGVIVEGMLSKYFGKMGITRIFTCSIFENNDGNSDENDKPSEGEGEDSNNDDKGPNNENNGEYEGDSIAIDDNGHLIPDGRIFKK